MIGAILLATLTVTARVDQPALEVGGVARVEVHARGPNVGEARIQPVRPPDGLEIGPPQGPKIMRLDAKINGRLTQFEELVWRFDVTPTRAGTFTVPAFVVQNGPELASSDPLTLRAVGTFDVAQFAFVETKVDPRPRFVGEPIVVELTVGLSEAWLDAEGERLLSAPWVAEGLGNGALPDPDMYPDPSAPGNVEIRSSSGASFSMKPGEEKRGAHGAFRTFTLRRSFVPTSSGALTVGPTSFRAVIATKTARDFLGSLVATETKLAAVSAPPVAIVVKPLPAGQPDDFSGLVGRFRVDAEASPRSAKVGETIRVKVTVSGDGNIGSTPLPKVDVPGFKRFGAVEDVDAAAIPPRRTLVYDLSPDSTDVSQIPAFRFPVFDTGAGTWKTLTTAPIPIKVAPGGIVAALTETPPPLAPSPTPTARGSDAGPVRVAPREPDRFGDALGIAAWGAAFVLPPLAVGAWIAARRRRPVRVEPRRTGAKKRFAAAIAACPPGMSAGAAAVGAALAHYLADVAEKPPETFVGAGEEALDPVIAERALRKQTAALLAECDAIAFGGGEVRPGELAALAEAIVEKLERQSQLLS